MDIILNKTLSEARALIPNEIEVYEYRVWQSNTANKVFVVLNNDNRICMYQENGFDRLMNQIDNLLIGKSISEAMEFLGPKYNFTEVKPQELYNDFYRAYRIYVKTENQRISMLIA